MGDNTKAATTTAATDERYLPLGTLDIRLPNRGPREWTPAAEDFRDALKRTVALFDAEDAETAERERQEGTPKRRGKAKEATEGDVARGLNWLIGDKDIMVKMEWKREGDYPEDGGDDMAMDVDASDATATELAPPAGSEEDVEPPISKGSPADQHGEGQPETRDQEIEVGYCSDSDLSTPPSSPRMSPTPRPSDLPPIIASAPAPPSAPTTPLPLLEPGPPPPPPQLYSCRVRISLLPADYGWRISQRRTVALRALFSVLRKGWDEGDGPVLEVSVSLLPSFLPFQPESWESL